MVLNNIVLVIQVCYGMFERCLMSLRYKTKWVGLEMFSSPSHPFNCSYYSHRNFCTPIPPNPERGDISHTKCHVTVIVTICNKVVI